VYSGKLLKSEPLNVKINQNINKTKPMKKNFTSFCIQPFFIALFLILGVQLNVNAQGGQKWTVDGNALSSTDFLGSTNNMPVIFKINSSEKVRINTNGNVGIGTNNFLFKRFNSRIWPLQAKPNLW
jgi:hypothetical protein